MIASRPALSGCVMAGEWKASCVWPLGVVGGEQMILCKDEGSRDSYRCAWIFGRKGKNSRECDEGHLSVKEALHATNRPGGSAVAHPQRAEMDFTRSAWLGLRPKYTTIH